MKHHIAKQLNEVADTMPKVFEWEMEMTVVEGDWLQFSPIADKQSIDPAQFYKVLLPVARAVDHKQQVKDAYKRGGLEEVRQYHRSVMDKIKNTNHDIKPSPSVLLVR